MERLIDLFDKIYKKQVEPAQEQDFFEKLTKDKQMAEDYKKYVLAIEVLNLQQNTQYVNAIHEQYVKGKSKKSTAIRSVVRIAASILIFCGVGVSYWLYLSTGSSLLEHNTITYIESTTRDENVLKAEIEILFMQGNFKQVLKSYSKLIKPEAKQTFLTAMSHFKLQQYSDAYIKLQELQKNNPKEYKNEVEFYIGQSLVGMNKIDEALAHFEKMPPNNPYYKNIDWWYKFKLRLLKLKYS